MSTPELTGLNPEYFPLDPVRVEASLAAIREDPNRVLVDFESEHLRFQNQNVANLLGIGQKILPDPLATAYTETALTIYKLIREAGTPTGILPWLSHGGKESLEMRTAHLAVSASQYELVLPLGFVSGVGRGLPPELESEPTVLYQVERLAAHRIDRDAYYAGAAAMVGALRFAFAEQN